MSRTVRSLVAAACMVTALGATRTWASELRLTFDTPSEESTVGGDDGQAFVAGRAMLVEPAAEQFDVMVVIDTSRSTAAPSGADVDGDGLVGSGRHGHFIDGTCDDWGDTVLAAQILATRTLLAQLNPMTTRVGIVTFSGDENPRTPDAVRLAPMTRDYAHLGQVLDYLLGHRPQGKTNIAEAVTTAASELLGEPGARSRTREGATRVVMLMTDGQPTLPGGREPGKAAALEAAVAAGRSHVRVDTFAIGVEANDDPGVMLSLAQQTGGVFTSVLTPTELIAHFEKLQLTRLASVTVRNRTAGREADHVVLEPDGGFSALVPLVDGENVIEVEGRSTDGATALANRLVYQIQGAHTLALSPRLAKRRTRVLENQLTELRTRSLELETEQGNEVRAELAREMEEARKERARALSVTVPDGD